MASAKVAKTKGKTDDKGKMSKSNTQEEEQDIDLTILRKPVTNCITNFAHAMKIYDVASDECKQLIRQECDLLYECKVCRSIFRSILNFISHKRIYCKEKFSTNDHGHFVRPMTIQNEIKSLKQLQKTVEQIVIDADSRIPLTKDLTALVEDINNKRGIPINTQGENIQNMTFQKITTTNNAVYQSVANVNEDGDSMKDQVNEINNLLSRDRAVIQEDGNCIIQNSQKPVQDTEAVILLSDDEDEEQSLVCKICKLQFSTVKTLKFHVKYKHLESRLVYPCPECVDIFCTSWSVYRHLFKVHRKSAAQIRRMRESIQAKAFKMNNPPASYEKRKHNVKPVVAPKMTERERHGQENQEWMDSMEGDSEVPRCGGCGRMFERRAALAAHTNTCQPRNRALTRRPDSKKIEIQIRKDYNKTPTSIIPANNNDSDAQLSEDVETVFIAEEPTKEKPVQKHQQSLLRHDIFDQKDSTDKDKKQGKVESVDDLSSEVDSAMSLAEQRNVEALKKLILPDVDIKTLTCKLCNKQSTSMVELTSHMAQHHNWRKFICKLCGFKHYVKSSIIKHVKMAHSLEGNEDFILSTIKVLEPSEAIEISRVPNRFNPAPANSKTSDDNSKSELVTRKRKLPAQVKTKKEKDDESNDLVSSRSEENSSDLDEVEDRLNKTKPTADEELLSVLTSRRPIRKRSKPKNDDFEYDLSNLLKLEAHGYKELTNARVAQSKKKVQSEPVSPVKEPCKDYSGTLLLLSKQAVEKSSAKARQFKLFNVCSPRNVRPYTSFLKPQLPILQLDKEPENTSPSKTKEADKDSSDCSEPMEINGIEEVKVAEDISENDANILDGNMEKVIVEPIETEPQTSSSINSDQINNQMPIKLRSKSLDVIKSPIINKSVTDYKSGVIPKVIVIKPINRKKMGDGNAENRIKYPTIKFRSAGKQTKTEGLKIVKLTPKPITTIVDKEIEPEINDAVKKDITIVCDEHTTDNCT